MITKFVCAGVASVMATLGLAGCAVQETPAPNIAVATPNISTSSEGAIPEAVEPIPSAPEATGDNSTAPADGGKVKGDNVLVGTWKLVSATSTAGQSFTEEQVKQTKYQLTFDGSGNAKVELDGKSDSSPYTFQNNEVTFSSGILQGMILKLDGGKLVSGDDAVVYTFEKQ